MSYMILGIHLNTVSLRPLIYKMEGRVLYKVCFKVLPSIKSMVLWEMNEEN